MMGDRMAILCMAMAFAAIVYSLVAMYRSFVHAYKRRLASAMTDADYVSMCCRIKPVEDDVRTNSGDHFEESEYLDRADKINRNTQIFSWINSQCEPYES